MHASMAMADSRPDRRRQVPGGTAGHFLLGSIYVKSNRRTEAVVHFCNALRSDPLCWCVPRRLLAVVPPVV